MIEKVLKVGDLYEIYGNLLTERGRQMIEMYYFEDWSLAEIADSLGVSRQAVHDHLRRAEEQLNAYEDVLHLHHREVEQARAIEQLEAVWTKVRGSVSESARRTMDGALDTIKRLL